MTPELTIAVARAHRVLRRAARALARAWHDVGGQRVCHGRAVATATGPTIRLGLGSVVRPSVTVRFAAPYRPAAVEAAVRLALTSAAWDAFGDVEVWRDLSAPLAPIPRWGRPDWSRPWVVALGGGPGCLAQPSLAGGQLHVIGGWRPPPRDAVWWPSWPGAAAAVLGRAAWVVGDHDPLTFDALRAQIPVGGPDEGASGGFSLRDDALAGLVPPSLLAEPRLWRHVATMARELQTTGNLPAPLMTPAWVGLGRQRIRDQLAAPPNGWERLRRRHDKLRRDPRAFLADSRFGSLRALGRLVYR